MHPLDGPRHKLRRADSQIDALGNIEAAYGRDSDYEVIKAEFNPKSGKDIYRVRTNSPQPALEWGVDIGEIAHNLRSALDGLVHQLALLETKTPARNTQFPIFLTGRTARKRVRHFEGMELGNGRSMIRQLHTKHQAMIEALQPYKRGRGGRINPLFLLMETNNADKHRLIQVVSVKWGGGPVFGGFVGDRLPDLPSIRGAVILKNGVKLFEAPRGMRVAPRFFPLIAFWKGCPAVERRGVTSTLRRIAEHISEIIEGFEAEFD